MQLLGICLLVGGVLIGVLFLCLFYKFYGKGKTKSPDYGPVKEDDVVDRNNAVIVTLQCPNCGEKFKVEYFGQQAEICDKCNKAFPIAGNICPGG